MARTRVKSDSWMQLPPVELYLDDLEYLLQAIAQHGAKRAELRYDQFAYASLSELLDHVKLSSIDSLSIFASGEVGSISVTMRPSQSTIYAGRDLDSCAVYVATFLRSKYRWYSWRSFNPIWYAVTGTLLTLPGILVIAIGRSMELPNAYTVLLGGVLMLLGFTILIADRAWFGGTRIRLAARDSTPTFWQRNRDTILVGAIVWALTAIGAFLMGRLTSQ